MVLSLSTETVRLIRDGEKGEGDMEVGEREIIYLSLHYHQRTSTLRWAVMRAILMFQ